MLHRASSPCPIIPAPPAVIRAHSTRPAAMANRATVPPALPEKSASRTAQQPSVPPPLSIARPPKPKDNQKQQDHLYENTIMIAGTKQHVVKNINLEVKIF